MRYGVRKPGFNAGRLFAPLATVVLLLAGALAAPGQAHAEAARLLLLGDSLTAGYGLPEQDGFAPRLEAALRERGHEVDVINAGVSGDTSAGGLARLDWALADRPTHAVVTLGANDGLRGLDPERMRENLDQIVARLRAEGIAVLLAGMKSPPNLGREYGERFETAYVEIADKHEVPLYPFFLDGVAAETALNQSDGIHPNARGVDTIVERILPSVEALLEAS